MKLSPVSSLMDLRLLLSGSIPTRANVPYKSTDAFNKAQQDYDKAAQELDDKVAKYESLLK